MTTPAVKHYYRPNRNGRTNEATSRPTNRTGRTNEAMSRPTDRTRRINDATCTVRTGQTNVATSHANRKIDANRRIEDEKLRNLFQAIKDGDVDKVKQILQENTINVNAVFLPDGTHEPNQDEDQRIRITGVNEYVDLHSNHPGNSPLHLAAAYGQDEICKILIHDWHADVDIRNHIGERPLHLAAIADAVEVCRVLIQDGEANVNAKNKIGSTPLHRAVDQNNPDVCRILIKEGKAKVNLPNKWGTPLHRAAGHDHTEICRAGGHDCTEICKILIEDGHADVNIRDTFGDTPLYKAASKKNLEACRILIEDGDAKVNRWNNEQDTPLHAAAEQNGAEVCQLLLQVGKANVNIKNKVGNTPLHCALKSGRTHAKVARVLLEVGDADTEIKNQEGKTALGYKIVGRQNAEIIKDTIKNVTNHKKMVAVIDSDERVKIFMCGNHGVGKTTLVNSMTKGFWSSLKRSNCAESLDAYCPTPGIQVKSKHIKGAGDFSVWDMAGQVESHLTHAMFLSKSNGIFIVTYDTSIPDSEKMEEPLHYWLRFLKSGHNAADTNPEIVIVGTHLDKHGNTEFAQKTAQSLLDELVMQYGQFLNIHKKSIVLDARQCGRQLGILKATLGRLSQPMRSGQIPRIYKKISKAIGQLHLPDVPMITWTEYVDNVKSIDPLADVDLIEKAAEFLHDTGKIFHVKLAHHDDVLILDIDWLTKMIFTPIFGKYDQEMHNPSLKNKKEYTMEELTDQMQVDHPQLAVALLKHFELAYSYRRDDVETFVIPTKLLPGVGEIKWQPDHTYARYTGFRIECKDCTDMFAVDVFPCIQVHMLNRYQQEGKEPILSLFGVKIMDEVEGMVQLTKDKAAIHIAVREVVGVHQDAARQLREMKQIVLDELEQRSAGTAIKVSYLSSKAMSRSMDLVTDVHHFSEKRVDEAKRDNTLLCSQNDLNSESVDSIMGCLADEENDEQYLSSGEWAQHNTTNYQGATSGRYQNACPYLARIHCDMSLPNHLQQGYQELQSKRTMPHVKSAGNILERTDVHDEHCSRESLYGCQRQLSLPSIGTGIQGSSHHQDMSSSYQHQDMSILSLQHLLMKSANPLYRSLEHLFRHECGIDCGWECIPQDTQTQVYSLLDQRHPLARDYRAMAEAFGHSVNEVKQIEQTQFRDLSISASIIKVAHMNRRQHRGRLTIEEVLTIIKHPGIVSSEKAAKLIEDFLLANGHQEPWKPYDLEFGIPHEVLLHRAIINKTRDQIRQHVKASEVIPYLEGPLTRDDMNEIARCEGGETYNYCVAVDMLLNKLMKLRDSNWYQMFLGALMELGLELVAEVLKHAEMGLRLHPAFATLVNETNC